MNATQLQSFGDLLRHYRIAAGLTQEALAERSQMSLAAVGKLERGTRQRPYRATITLLADALSLTADERLELERAAHRGALAVSAQQVRAAINLPVHFSSFVGRERDVAKVCEMLAIHRLVTLVGVGGVGKTRLAARAAEHFIAANSTGDQLDGVWFADLSAPTDGQMATATVASSVGMKQCRTLDALVGYLRSQRFLLILDNCEHLVDDVARLAGELLRQCPNAQIIATSRQQLDVDGERVYRVPPLSAPDATRLFVDRAEAADSRFELTDSNIPAVAEICRRLDGIALAIELAAARTSAFPAATIAQRLDEHFLLFTGRMQSLSRHKTMRAVFDWSYDLLDPNEQSVFRRLSLFVGGFTLDLATSLWSGEIEEAAIVEILASLVNKSLVQCDTYAEPPRYKMLEPARQYAREQLREHAEQNHAARAHASALLALAQGFDSRLESTPDEVWDAYVEREGDNFRSALEWALGPHGDPNLAQRLAGSRCACWCGFRSGEVRKWVSAAIASCNETTPPKVVAKLAISAALTAISFEHDAEESVAASRRALSLQQADDLPALATAQYLLGVALENTARLDEADSVLREAIATARSCGAQNQYAFATQALGAVRLGAGDLDEARKLISETLRLNRASGSKRDAANATVALAELEFASGDAEEALRLSEEAAHFFRSRSDLLRLSMTLCNASAHLLALCRYQEARSYAREALRCSRAVGGTSWIVGWTVQHLAAFAVLNDDSRENETPVRRAANILGFVNEMERQGTTPRYQAQRQEYEKALCALRAVVPEDELVKLMADGEKWSQEQAVAEALML